MNALWAGMMLMAIIYGTFHGTIPAVTQAALDSAKEAVSLCITMLGILSFWMGLMQVGSASGLIGRMTRGIRPALRCLFPGIPEEHPEEDRHRVARPVKEGVMRPRSRVVPPGTASDEMCTFLVLNISSLQLIPVNIIAYRSQYGSVDPAAIIGPAIVATMVSTGVGVIFCLLMQKKSSG